MAPTPFNKLLPVELRQMIWDWSCLPEPGVFRLRVATQLDFELHLGQRGHPWVIRKRKHPVALHVDRFSRKTAQSVQHRENGHAVRQGQPPVQYHIGRLERPFDPDIDTLFFDDPTNGRLRYWRSVYQYLVLYLNPGLDLRCQTVKHLAVHVNSIHCWITAERKVTPGVELLFSNLEHISVVVDWPSWPDRTGPHYIVTCSTTLMNHVFWERSPYRMHYIQLLGRRKHTPSGAARLRAALPGAKRFVRPRWRKKETWPILNSLCGPDNVLGFVDGWIKLTIARVVRAKPYLSDKFLEEETLIELEGRAPPKGMAPAVLWL